MAQIVEKNIRRYRVQFTMSRSLHSTYQRCMKQAEQLQVVLDFSRDFEKWFSGQLEQVSRTLAQMAEEKNESQSESSFLAQQKEESHGEDN